MIRHQFHAQVRVQHWREFYSLYEKLEELRRAKDLAPSQLWSPTVGQVNSALLITDYETIEAFDRQSKAFLNDPDLMRLWREMGGHVEGNSWDELWESAFQIA